MTGESGELGMMVFILIGAISLYALADSEMYTLCNAGFTHVKTEAAKSILVLISYLS